MSRKNLALVTLLTVTVVVASVTAQAVGPCVAFKGVFGGPSYTASFSTSVHSGDPTTVCLKGEPVYDFTVSVSGTDGSSGSNTFPVCSILSNPVTLYDSAGTAHTFEPKHGLTWGDVHSSSQCKVVSWSIQ